jgi:chemotaxis protein methyltransferase CheR
MTMAEALRSLTEQTIGFTFTGDEVERRLVPLAAARAAELQLASPWAYLELLRSEPASGGEWRRLIELVTNGQTSFFRDPEQFAALGELVAAVVRDRGRVNLWSAGCSTGEEPYSLAILCGELGLADRTTILATDINRGFLARAREARYSEWALRKVAPERRSRWFHSVGGDHRARAELLGLVDFRRHNLVADQPPHPEGAAGWDLILCRNVFLYFGRDRMADACRRMTSVLAPGGWLVLAASESLRGLDLALAANTVRGRVFYRRGPLATAAASSTAAAPAIARRRPTLPFAPVARRTVPEPDRPDRIPAAIALARRGRIRDALDALSVSGPAGEPGLLHHLTAGHLRLRLHEVDHALSAYRGAAAIDPLLCEVHYFEGIAHRKAGAWSAAAEALRRALFLAPTFWQAAYLLAGVHERLGAHRDANRQRSHARRLLAERSSAVAFLSDPLFLAWLSVDRAVARRALRL